jgi:hypothetical protein
MGSMTASVGKDYRIGHGSVPLKTQLMDSMRRLSEWLEKNDYRGYDTFDGLNARFVRPFTFERASPARCYQGAFY